MVLLEANLTAWSWRHSEPFQLISAAPSSVFPQVVRDPSNVIEGGDCRKTVCGLCLCVMQSLRMSDAEASLRRSKQRINIAADCWKIRVQLPTGLQYFSNAFQFCDNGWGLPTHLAPNWTITRRHLFAIQAPNIRRDFGSRSSTCKSAYACRARQNQANVRALQSCEWKWGNKMEMTSQSATFIPSPQLI